MKALLDACVLFPTATREVLLGLAAAGRFRPLWSERILEEWARATPKLGEGAETVARGEIAALRAAWPDAAATVRPGTEAKLWLPDPNDVHVLAAAIDGGADVLVTFNKRDFPRRELDGWGIRLIDPDALAMDAWLADGDAVERVVATVFRTAGLRGYDGDRRSLLKRAKMPRLGKALG